MNKLESCLFIILSLTLVPTTVFSKSGNAKEAVFSWSGQGKLFQTGPNSVDFMGVIQGVLYIGTPGEALDEAFMECSFRNSLLIQEKSSQADGKCVIVKSPEDNVYASFSCQGQTGVCAGKLVFESGTGKFKGIKGGANMMVRSPLRLLAPSLAGGEELSVANGVALFTDIDFEVE